MKHTLQKQNNETMRIINDFQKKIINDFKWHAMHCDGENEREKKGRGRENKNYLGAAKSAAVRNEPSAQVRRRCAAAGPHSGSRTAEQQSKT